MMTPSFAPGEHIPQGLSLRDVFSGGLGDAAPGPTFTSVFPTDALGYTIPCDSAFNYLVSPACWKFQLATWQEIASKARSGAGVPFTQPAIQAPAAVPLAYSNSPVYSGDPGDLTQYNAEINASLAQAMQQTQANLLAQAQSVEVAPGGSQGGSDSTPNALGIPWYVWAAIAGVGLVAFARR